MTTCATACATLSPSTRSVRVLRWTFRRHQDAVVCELGLNSDDSAYELRVNAESNPAGITMEHFDDVMAAFERHAALERVLVDDGWMLEGFESEPILRTL
jgi:hypothetical protein